MFSFKSLFSVFFSVFLLHQVSLYAQALYPTTAIFPLYIYPGSDCAAWTTLFDSITANPDLLFYVIINPSNGPDNFDSSYQTCVTQLAALSDNVKIVGYVLTEYGTRDSSDVLDDIATYMALPTAYRPTGIFFDETLATSEYLADYTKYAEQVRSDVTNGSVVILNPGINVADTSYFSIADFIVTAESFYDEFDWLSSLIIDSLNPAGQQIVLLHDGPTTLPDSLIKDLVGVGIAATFITNVAQDTAYETIPPYWKAECKQLSSVQA